MSRRLEGHGLGAAPKIRLPKKASQTSFLINAVYYMFERDLLAVCLPTHSHSQAPEPSTRVFPPSGSRLYLQLEARVRRSSTYAYLHTAVPRINRRLVQLSCRRR